MKLKFKKQQYQDDASRAVVDCFIGQEKRVRKEIGLKDGLIEEIYYTNAPITLTDTERRTNIRHVQRANEINFTDNAGLTDFTIEMETGTGKTYTYIKTMYDLNNAYGWSKFIVMVPSIAIREGVLKSFQTTQEHFQEIYHKKIRFFVYNSNNGSNVTNINTFVSDDNIQVMIINYQAFNSEEKAKGNNKRIYKELDELQSRRPIDVINSVRPILILDEPQKISDKTEEKLKAFKPLFTLRYSATHKKEKEYNKIFRLDAIDAYNQYLVKKINVKGIELLHNKAEDTYLFLDSVNISNKQDPEAIIEIETKSATGVTRKLVKVKAGDNLYDKSGKLQQYKGYKVSEIDGRYDQYDKVVFTNGVEIQVGQAFGDVEQEHITRMQIRETIRTHFEKEQQLYKLGIKVLSLFFIDEVAKYKDWSTGQPLKGNYAKIFEEEYARALADYRTIFDDDYTKYLDSFDTGKIHAGYFSVDKKGHEIDSTINDKKEKLSFDEDAYDLIMKNKERLLSLNEPVRFIFSHSALREGWDNPNIFQICTLKHNTSEISKRQEIGRGLRICVNNDGERMDYSMLEREFHSINTLTVVASESYDSFAKALQNEMLNNLSDRPTKLTMDWLFNKVLTNSEGKELVFDNANTFEFMSLMKEKEYIDSEFKITNKFIEDKEFNILDFGSHFKEFENEISKMISGIYSADRYEPAADARRENINSLTPNDNFNKKEFQELWNKINIKTVYEVDFDTEKLIDRSIQAIDGKLIMNKMKIRVTEGSQKDKLFSLDLKSLDSMKQTKEKTETIESYFPSPVEYDLVGELTNGTGLTRKSIIRILSKISPQKFDWYKYNPEEFIRKVTNLINQEKALLIIDGITYHKTGQKYSNEIFNINNVHAQLGVNAIEVKKHIYDYLVTDSKTEKEFAKKLEVGEVAVYAKLPSQFKIPTPVGNYNPDWAIVFDNPTFKNVYFVAETKGSNDPIQLRDIERAKIECAKKHFQCISDDAVKYDVVDSYEKLIELVTN